ncbi:MAG TPA: redoxin domain-containing protein, partial [Nitrospirota bacterium]|nr:redoxin domain-containing protein [Nitrospirota bacterium]
MKKIIVATLLLFLLASSAFALRVNDPAPIFSLRDIKEVDFHLSDLVGVARNENNNGVILSFFASWCVPCRKELPLINSLVDE